eukprot:180541-Hanusia_phi.AAC.3
MERSQPPAVGDGALDGDVSASRQERESTADGDFPMRARRQLGWTVRFLQRRWRGRRPRSSNLDGGSAGCDSDAKAPQNVFRSSDEPLEKLSEVPPTVLLLLLLLRLCLLLLPLPPLPLLLPLLHVDLSCWSLTEDVERRELVVVFP